MPISLPDDPKLHHRASAAGFATVEEYLLQLVEQDELRRAAQTEASGELTNEEWVSDFRAFLQTLPSRNPHFDDSRESIYPVR